MILGGGGLVLHMENSKPTTEAILLLLKLLFYTLQNRHGLKKQGIIAAGKKHRVLPKRSVGPFSAGADDGYRG